FSLDALGDDLFLSSNAGGTVVGGYREHVDFPASAPEVSFGRYTKSTGGTDFVAMSAPTFGAPNALPLVGPVVINEIMYDPAPGGPSLARVTATSYGNDAGSWVAGPPGGTPGIAFIPPAAPSGLTASATSPVKVHLAWTDNAATEDGTRLERSADNVAFTVVA